MRKLLIVLGLLIVLSGVNASGQSGEKYEEKALHYRRLLFISQKMEKILAEIRTDHKNYVKQLQKKLKNLKQWYDKMYFLSAVYFKVKGKNKKIDVVESYRFGVKHLLPEKLDWVLNDKEPVIKYSFTVLGSTFEKIAGTVSEFIKRIKIFNRNVQKHFLKIKKHRKKR